MLLDDETKSCFTKFFVLILFKNISLNLCHSTLGLCEVFPFEQLGELVGSKSFLCPIIAKEVRDYLNKCIKSPIKPIHGNKPDLAHRSELADSCDRTKSKENQCQFERKIFS